MTKAAWEQEGLFDLQFYITVQNWRESEEELNQDRNLEAGANAKVLEDCYLLTCPTWIINMFSYSIQEHMPRSGNIHNGQGPCISFTQLKCVLQGYMEASLIKALLKNCSSLLSVDFTHKKLT